ncbi:MAG: hypothetical protein ACK4TA_21985 [Saprospiraceae bacterium]
MQKSKVIQLLRACDSTEFAALAQFLASPYYNEDKKVIALFDYLQQFYPTFTAPELNKKNVFRVLFPQQDYDDKLFRYLLSDLNKRIEKFLAVRAVEQEASQLTLALLETLSTRGLHKHYQQVARQWEEAFAAKTAKNSTFFKTQLAWSEIKEQHFQRQRVRKFDPSLQDFANDLDKYYFLHRLKIACAMLDRKSIFQAEYDVNISAQWIQHLEAQQCFTEPLIQVYYTIFQALMQEYEESYYILLKNYIQEYASAIAKDDLKDIYLFAINYCARKIRQGKANYVSEALQLYQVGIEQAVLIDEQGLSPWAFTNVVKLALRLQHYTWIENFIQQYAPKMPETFRENALHYNLAELYYYTQRFDLAQAHLNQVAFSDLNYYLGARVLLAKIFYELKEEEALLSLISSFTIFLKRNKQLSNDLKHTYLNFCQILFQIMRRSPAQMPKLKEKISATKLLTDRAWLEEIYNKNRRS